MIDYINISALIARLEEEVERLREENGDYDAYTDGFSDCVEFVDQYGDESPVMGLPKRLTCWIPCAECYPKADEMVLVWARTKKGVGSVNRAWFDGTTWHGSGSMAGVTHWMPMPAEPEIDIDNLLS